jgi:Bacteriophage lambda head decoration protein D
MADVYIGNLIPAPGFYVEDEMSGDELLASMARFTQRGITLAAGEGIIPLGTVMARRTADKRYVPYATAGGGGTDTARGVLRNGVDTGSDEDGKEYQGNLVTSGILKNDKVKIPSGDSGAAVADLNARQDTVLNIFVF